MSLLKIRIEEELNSYISSLESYCAIRELDASELAFYKLLEQNPVVNVLWCQYIYHISEWNPSSRKDFIQWIDRQTMNSIEAGYKKIKKPLSYHEKLELVMKYFPYV